MTGSNYSSYLTIETVSTDAGNLFRLGTKYTDTLSLTYALTYGGLTDAQLSVLNPTSYTASDAATLLNNPTKEGFLFAGWTCESLGVTVPQEKMVIPEGTTGALTLIAMWVEAPAGSGKTGENSTSPKAAEDAQAPAEEKRNAAAAGRAPAREYAPDAHGILRHKSDVHERCLTASFHRSRVRVTVRRSPGVGCSVVSQRSG